MACTITDKEKEVLTNAGFSTNWFDDWCKVSLLGDITSIQKTDAGLWCAQVDADSGRGYIAKSRSVSALLVYCQLADWKPVCTDPKAAPLVGG